MSELKVGTKIKIIKDKPYGGKLKIDQIYPITAISRSMITVNGYNLPKYRLGNYYEIVNEPNIPQFKPGDKIKCINISHGYNTEPELNKIYSYLGPSDRGNDWFITHCFYNFLRKDFELYKEETKPLEIKIGAKYRFKKDCLRNKGSIVIISVYIKEAEYPIRLTDGGWFKLSDFNSDNLEMVIDVPEQIKEKKVMKTEEVSKGLAGLIEGLLSESIESSKTELQAFKAQNTKELSEFKTKVMADFEALSKQNPIMQIKLTETGHIKKLTAKVNPLLPRLIVNSRLGLYTMLIGPAGCGKTTLAHQLAESLEVPFAAVCLTAGASETWLFGRQTANGFVEGPFAKTYKNGGVFLADEMDAADANLLLSMNTALSHNQFINPMNGELMEKHKDFIFVGAANTNGKGADHVYTGRCRLDAATLDRFVLLNVDYDKDLEAALCPDTYLYNALNEIRKELKSKELDEFVSTRAYKNLYSLHQAGIKYKDLWISLTSNWSEASKKIANDIYDRMLKTIPENIPDNNLFKIINLETKPKRGRKPKVEKVDDQTIKVTLPDNVIVEEEYSKSVPNLEVKLENPADEIPF